MSTAQRPDPTESVRHQLRPLLDQIVIKELDEERLLVCRVVELLGVLESATRLGWAGNQSGRKGRGHRLRRGLQAPAGRRPAGR